MLNTAPPFGSSHALLVSVCAAILLLAACDIAFVDDDSSRTVEDATPTPDDLGDATSPPQQDTADEDSSPTAPLPDEEEDAGDTTTLLFQQWGTAGSSSTTPRSSGGFGFCGRVDIRQDDIQAGERDVSVPTPPWGEEPVADVQARCGDDFETTAWRLMNCERMTAGLEPLSCDLRLVWLGREHSTDMKDNNYFDHEGLDGSSPFERMSRRGIGYTTAGENIAMYPNVEAASLGWMDSEGHRSNILNSAFSHGAIGISAGGNNRYYLTQLFIRPRSR